jgi:8-oxo-dGTP diphosphatase
MRAKYGISTVCYLEVDNRVLFLHFNKKWGQVYAPPGGKINEGESPRECIIREFREETGLTLVEPVLKGYSHWNWQNQEYGIIFIYTSKGCIGELKQSAEGNVSWVEKNEISKLNQFDMNSKFTDLIFEDIQFEGNFLLNKDDSVKEYTLTKFRK